LVFVNGFLDILDGAIAKKYGTSKFGDFLDHTFDRLADIAILVGIAFNPNIPNWLGFATIIVILLVSYMGTQAQALTKKRLYTAIASRADRILILGLGGIIAAFYFDVLYYALWLLLALSVITFFQRFYLTSQKLK
ncbi:CDP-alcohol phosphatidyltransferase family protein, partial [Candidatus Woesearchaeota archaeon]|nr:CDP-alcohol phosphatidyltransferase family protein [Candidatus Woesearchaeota archaeon]